MAWKISIKLFQNSYKQSEHVFTLHREEVQSGNDTLQTSYIFLQCTTKGLATHGRTSCLQTDMNYTVSPVATDSAKLRQLIFVNVSSKESAMCSWQTVE